jgi:hypothetical protein
LATTSKGRKREFLEEQGRRGRRGNHRKMGFETNGDGNFMPEKWGLKLGFIADL